MLHIGLLQLIYLWPLKQEKNKMDGLELIDFKRLYVSTHQLYDKIAALLYEGISDTESLDLAVNQVDIMISVMPVGFDTISLEYPDQFVMHVNMNDAEDEPEETSEIRDGKVVYRTPENTQTLFEDTLRMVLENLKFLLWNLMTCHTKDPLVRKKYLPLTLEQADFCMWKFSNNTKWEQWEKEMYVLYANQVGWFTYEEEQDMAKLAAALLVVEKGDLLSDWAENAYIKHTKFCMLLKLGRVEEAYEIVKAAFNADPDFKDFIDMKADAGFVAWLKEQTL